MQSNVSLPLPVLNALIAAGQQVYAASYDGADDRYVVSFVGDDWCSTYSPDGVLETHGPREDA